MLIHSDAIIKAILEDEEDFDADIVKEVEHTPEEASDIQLAKMLPGVIRKKEDDLCKPCVNISQDTNDRGETYCYGQFGRHRKKGVIVTLAYLHPKNGWQVMESMSESEDGPSIRGEYWVIDGDVQFADGDVGDINHEGYAIGHARHAVLDAIDQSSDEEFIDDEMFTSSVIEALNDEGIEVSSLKPKDLMLQLTEYLTAQYPDEAERKLLVSVASGDDAADARYLAVRYWGWIWVRGNNFTLWQYDQRKLLKAVQAVLDSEDSDGEADWHDFSINVTVAATKRHYSTTVGELDSGANPGHDPSWPMAESEEDDAEAEDLKDVYGEPPAKKFLPMGTVSRATADADDLIPRFVHELGNIDPGEAELLATEYDDILNEEEAEDVDPNSLKNELLMSIIDNMNEHVPTYTYFGSSEGDGTDYGVWPATEAIDEAIEAGTLLLLKQWEPLVKFDGYIVIADAYGMYIKLLTGDTHKVVWEYE